MLAHKSLSTQDLISYHTKLQEFAIMVGTIEKALNPFHLVICFLGCGIFRHSLYHSRLCFSTFYILIVWSVYACVFYYILISFSSNKIFNGFLIFFIVLTNLFATIISVINTIRKHKVYFSFINILLYL